MDHQARNTSDSAQFLLFLEQRGQWFFRGLVRLLGQWPSVLVPRRRRRQRTCVVCAAFLSLVLDDLAL
jgi:hypothetical protein